MSKCKFCGKEGTWIKQGRKNILVEGNGTTHRCEEMMNSLKSIKTFTKEEIENYRKQNNKKP